MPDDPPQPWWVQPAGRLQQHRFGLDRGGGGQLVGAVGQHAAVGGRQLAVGQGLAGLSEGATEQGPGGADAAVGGAGAHPEAGPQPTGRGGRLEAVFGAGSAAGIDGREGLEPVAFQAVQQPPQRQHPLGRDRVSQAVEVLSGQLVDGRRQGGQGIAWLGGGAGGQLVRSPGRRSGRLPGAVPDRISGRMVGRLPGRMCVRFHDGNLSSPRPNTSTNPKIVDNRLRRSTRPAPDEDAGTPMGRGQRPYP
jgi:hypothetical protein